jgi:DeoR/GlpR family transcriptional regulator of sugar metabolism
MLRAARTRVLLIDNAKLRRTALYRLAPLTDFDLVLVDDQAPAEQVAALRDQGAAVEVVPV